MLLLLFILSSIIFAIELKSHIQVICEGRTTGRTDHKKHRMIYMLKSAFFQNRVRERWWGRLHTIIFYTFIIFLIDAIELMIQSVWSDFSLTHLLGPAISGIIYIIQTYFAWMCLCAVIVLMIRRFAKRKTLRSTFDAWLILGLILFIMISHFGVISSLIANKLISGNFASFLPVMTYIGSKYTDPDLIHTLCAWIHIICVCTFLIWIPRGKHLHIVMAFPALLNQYRLYVNNTPVTGLNNPEIESYEKALESAIEKDLPESEWPVIGTEKFKDLSRRPRLEAFACTQCQRCTDVCPMVSANLDNVAGPMQSMLNLRNLCMNHQISSKLIPEISLESEIWSCTQCGACDRTCGVGVEHTNRILQIRQAVVCREKIPPELNKVFAEFEKTGNPWGYPKSQRLTVSVPGYKDIPKNEMILNLRGETCRIHTILFFVGCMGYYDQAFNKTVNHTINWLCQQGFEVKLLNNEQCCGESMRKLGNESAFAQHMQNNLAEIQKIPHDLILTACPHCAQILSNDYITTQYVPKAMHVWDFLAHLNTQKPVLFNHNHQATSVLHMPCLLGKRPESPAKMLKMAELAHIQIKDKDVSRSHCCGAGGGQFFMDKSRKIAEMRTQELISSAPDHIITACPFCYQMLQDEVLRKNLKQTPQIIQILDLLDS